ncbi:F-box/LRR-repeat protein [Trifolium repens]|nr:F-box/LRR-repeat protein [Trifolium repens]
MVSSYLPDECWESIFRFIINIDDDYNNNNYLNSLSLVSKQFLSITNRLRLSLTFSGKLVDNIFKRFPNFNSLNSLNLKTPGIELDKLLIKISCFPLKITSLNLSNQPTIPANGLRAFSKKITTLTSLTCSYIGSINSSDLFLIADCFPLLEELDLSYPSYCKDYSNYVDGVESLSLALIKLRKVNLSEFPINNQSLFHLFNNCKYLEEVIMFGCNEITNAALASALRERPTLMSLSFSLSLFHPEYRQVFATSHFIDSFVSMKGLTCLDLKYLNISDELLYSIAREGFPLTRLVLRFCTNFSYNGIFCLLSKCRGIQHLNLQHADFLNDQHLVQLSLFLGDLLSINLSCC